MLGRHTYFQPVGQRFGSGRIPGAFISLSENIRQGRRSSILAQMVLPVLVIATTAIDFVLQHKFLKNFNRPEPVTIADKPEMVPYPNFSSGLSCFYYWDDYSFASESCLPVGIVQLSFAAMLVDIRS